MSLRLNAVKSATCSPSRSTTRSTPPCLSSKAVPYWGANVWIAIQCANGQPPLFGDAPPETLNGGLQSASTARPEYWRASDCSPKSLSIGFVDPCRAMSRRRIVSCIFAQLPACRSRSNCLCGLKTRVGHGNLRACRELPPCKPTTYNGSEAKLKAKRAFAGSQETCAFQACRTTSIWWSCCNANQRRFSNCFSARARGSRNIATKEAKAFVRRTLERTKPSRSRARSVAHCFTPKSRYTRKICEAEFNAAFAPKQGNAGSATNAVKLAFISASAGDSAQGVAYIIAQEERLCPASRTEVFAIAV